MEGVIQQRKAKNIPPITVRGANLTDCRGEGIFVSTEQKGRLAGQSWEWEPWVGRVVSWALPLVLLQLTEDWSTSHPLWVPVPLMNNGGLGSKHPGPHTPQWPPKGSWGAVSSLTSLSPEPQDSSHNCVRKPMSPQGESFGLSVLGWEHRSLEERRRTQHPGNVFTKT